MLIDYDIREITTQRQAKNGTREFEFPVPCYSKQRLEWFKRKKYNLKELPRLRIASFKSGYVRKQNGAYTAYQLNPVYMQARALIYSPLTRLNFMLNYYLKNYA
jgi:hypothetical protein